MKNEQRGPQCSKRALALTAFAACAASLPLGVADAGAALAAEPQVVASGRFSGRSRHTAAGGASVLATDAGFLVVLESDFSFDGAPDPKLGFGQGGFRKATLFAPLRANGGAQVYALPKDFDPSGYNELWIWCEKFNVPLGVAKLR